MSLISTRDATGEQYSYTDALLQGLAPDGGLYVPDAYPTVSTEELIALKGAPYGAIVKLIKEKLVGDTIDSGTLERLIAAAYTNEKFPEVENEQYTPVRRVKDNLYIQNLSLGPTAAFKDMAMQQLGQEMNYELNRRDEELVILGATSGDTGSAAEAALKGLERVKLFMLSPEEGMSPFQKGQMGSLSGDNIFNISIQGRFDDCQDLVKAIKQEAEFAHLGAVNSINWGRISSQIPYYFSGYLQTAAQVGDLVDFVVPSGNFGNVLAGYYAKQMGLPIRHLIVATNENDVLHTLFETGVYTLSPTQVTSSPSMDISKASNYERLAFDVLGRDPEALASYMKIFNETGTVDIKQYGADHSAFSTLGFKSGHSHHALRLETITSLYEATGQAVDPHTADGVAVARQHYDVSEEIPMVCMETALPVKFEATLTEALGATLERPERFVGMEEYATGEKFMLLPISQSQLESYIRSH